MATHTLSVSQLETRLFAVRGSRFIGLTALTVPRMRKTDNPWFGRVTKVSRVGGSIGFAWKYVVNRQRKREGKPQDFRPTRRQWGERIKGTPLVSHVTPGGETRIYLEVKPQTRAEDFHETTTGTLIDRDELTPFLNRSELRHNVDIRDFRIDNIAELRIDGDTLRISPAIVDLRRLVRRSQKAVAK